MNWTIKRWKTSWNDGKDCSRTKKYVGWASDQLRKKLLTLNRMQLKLVIQVLTGHCNLQKHKKTTGRTDNSVCPKCGVEDETPNHHVGRCNVYIEIRREFLGANIVSLQDIVKRLNIRKLAAYLKQAGRLVEYDAVGAGTV